MTRDAKPGELREIQLLELLEKYSKRPESRVDIHRILERLSPNGKIYAKHLVMSGPSSIAAAAKVLELKKEDVELAIQELEKAIATLKS